MIQNLMLAIAVSLDSLSAGCSYGLRNIRIPFFSKLIIACCSGGVIFVTMSIGQQLKQWVPTHLMHIVGIALLIYLGCIAIYQGLRATENQTTEKSGQTSAWNMLFRILRTPAKADVDQSGSISSWEAVLLGVALSLDAFGVGLGAVMLNFSTLWLSFWITLTAGLFLHLGMKLGLRMMSVGGWTRYLSCVPGLLLILLGLSRLW